MKYRPLMESLMRGAYYGYKEKANSGAAATGVVSNRALVDRELRFSNGANPFAHRLSSQASLSTP
jgi:hypothetical protein